MIHPQTLGIYEQISYSTKFERKLVMDALLVVMEVVERMMLMEGKSVNT